MRKKIVLFTALNHGGILQFANQIALILKDMDIPFVLYIPSGAKKSCAEAVIREVIEYKLPRFAISVRPEVQKLADRIVAMNPSCFIAIDDAIKSSAIVSALAKKVKCAIVIHDVFPHPQTPTLYKILAEKFRGFLARQAYKKAQTIILLSQNSYRLFQSTYRKISNKAMVFPLGAHVMPAIPIMPKELQTYNNLKGFALFFGRIDKYKGIERLLKAQEKNCKETTYDLPVIIAGKNLSNEDYKTSAENKTICLLRFISDGELIWLFEHCSVVVLPYYEASQSGVLPIAYKYGKPVIVSNINGLRELVIKDKTGHIFEDAQQLSVLLKEYAVNKNSKPNIEILKFYKDMYDWKINMNILLKKLVNIDE